MRRNTSIAAGVFGLVLLLTGCSGEAPVPDEVAASSVETTPLPVSPLAEYMDLVEDSGWGLDVETRLQLIEAQTIRQEELVSQCMHAAGFDLDFNDPATIPVDFRILNSGWGAFNSNPSVVQDRNWVAQWGYGIVLNPWQDYLVEVPVRLSQDTAGTRQMSETEMFAFREALEGSFDGRFFGGSIMDQLEDGMSEREIQEQRGCRGWSEMQLAEESPSGLVQSDEFAPLFEAINQMRITFSSEVGPEEFEWAACMADAGYPQFEQRSSPAGGFEQPMMQIIRVRERIAFNDPGPIPVGERTVQNTPALAELLDQEIDLALADYDCREAVDFSVRSNARRVAAETQFVNDNRLALNALRDAAEQRSLP